MLFYGEDGLGGWGGLEGWGGPLSWVIGTLSWVGGLTVKHFCDCPASDQRDQFYCGWNL